MSNRLMSPLEPRNLFSIDLPGLIDPGTIENFNGVKIDASLFPASAVTVQVTSTGPKIALPLLRNGVVIGTETSGGSKIVVSNRVGIDPTSDLPGIVFYEGTENADAGVQIFGNVSDGVDAFDSINDSLNAALTSLQSTRATLAQLGVDTTELDAQIADLTERFDAVRKALADSLTSPFVRVTLPGAYDAYFLASEVKEMRLSPTTGDGRNQNQNTDKPGLVGFDGSGNSTASEVDSVAVPVYAGAAFQRVVAGTATAGRASNMGPLVTSTAAPTVRNIVSFLTSTAQNRAQVVPSIFATDTEIELGA